MRQIQIELILLQKIDAVFLIVDRLLSCHADHEQMRKIVHYVKKLLLLMSYIVLFKEQFIMNKIVNEKLTLRLLLKLLIN